MNQRLGLAMRDENLFAAGFRDGLGQPGPVGVIGNDERKLDPALARAGANPHPPGGESRHRIGKFARPEILQRARRADHDFAGKLGAIAQGDAAQIAKLDPLGRIIGGEPLHRAMQIDRPLIARGPQQRDDPLRLAERIGADEMRAIWKQPLRGEKLADLVARPRMAEHGKPEGRLGDEDVAGERLEGGAGRIRLALVIAGGDDDLALVRHSDLGRAENMAGRMEADVDGAEPQRFAIGDRLLRAGEIARRGGWP